MGEVNRAYRSFNLNTEESLKPNKTCQYTSESNNYDTYEDFKDDFLEINKESTRFRQYFFTNSNHYKFWKHVFEGTELCIEKGGESNVSHLE